jgi:hypothetical protein
MSTRIGCTALALDVACGKGLTINARLNQIRHATD